MLVSNHVLAGIVIGRALRRHPLAAFGAGVVSHFAMDACPHWGVEDSVAMSDDKFIRVAKCDGCAGLAAMALAAGLSPGRARKAVVAGMVGAALPDADKPIEYFFGVNPFPPPFRRFHASIQREAAHRLPHEVASAALLGIVAMAALRWG
jgi:hypothetical protein